MRFSYVKYDDEATELQRRFKAAFEILEEMTRKDLKSPRPRALVFTKLEEAYMWVGKAIRDDQVERNGEAEEQPERANQ